MRRQLYARRTTDPTDTPISVTDLKAHLRLDGLPADTTQDALLGLYIKAAVEHIETSYGIALFQQTWTAKIDWGLSAGISPAYSANLPCWMTDDEIELPMPPVISVTSIKYFDNDGVEQTMSTSIYQVDTFARPGRILRVYNQSWPDIRPDRLAVTIVWVAGYADAAHVPENIKHAIKLLCGHWYANRENVVVGTVVNEMPDAAAALLAPYKNYRF